MRIRIRRSQDYFGSFVIIMVIIIMTHRSKCYFDFTKCLTAVSLLLYVMALTESRTNLDFVCSFDKEFNHKNESGWKGRPWMAFVKIKGNDEMAICGGSLLNRRSLK